MRLSTYSTSPSFSAQSTPESTGRAEITQITQGLDRLENKSLAEQRFVPSERKSEDLSKLALGAKVERALGRRMVGQDAEMRIREKPRVEKEGHAASEKSAGKAA